MSNGVVRSELRSVATGLVTPFDDGLDIDHDALASNVRGLYERGVRTFFACGNISEYHALSHEERKAVTRTSVDAVPDDATVLAGAGGSVGTVVDLATEAADSGADAIMVMPPDHTFKHERGLLEYYETIGRSVDPPLVPYLRRFDPSVDFVAALSDLDSVVGVKWAIDDVPKFGAATTAGDDDVVWLNGLGERHAISMYAEGARGMASGVGNFEPVVGLELFAALEDDDLDRARAVRDAALPYMRFREGTGDANTLPGGQSVPAVKAGLEFAGLTGGRVRPPLWELDEDTREQAEHLYDDLSAFIETELDRVR